MAAACQRTQQCTSLVPDPSLRLKTSLHKPPKLRSVLSDYKSAFVDFVYVCQDIGFNPYQTWRAINFFRRLCQLKKRHRDLWFPVFAPACIFMTRRIDCGFDALDPEFLQSVCDLCGVTDIRDVYDLEDEMSRTFFVRDFGNTPFDLLSPEWSRVLEYLNFSSVEHIVNITVVSTEFHKYFDSCVIAASAVSLARHDSGFEDPWPDDFARLTGVSKEEIVRCVKWIRQIAKSSSRVPEGSSRPWRE